jgi:hypothetical protein
VAGGRQRFESLIANRIERGAPLTDAHRIGASVQFAQ